MFWRIPCVLLCLSYSSSYLSVHLSIASCPPRQVSELYLRGIKLRGLAHPGHWKGPLGPFFESFGAVKASPLAAYKLLSAGEPVLLFPGGAREVCTICL
jgi:hypothetical protein